MRTATSFVNVEDAWPNLRTEIPGWDFKQVVRRTRAEWVQCLG